MQFTDMQPVFHEPVFGMVAEFPNPHALLEAVKGIRAAGLSRIDTHTPFPIHGMDKAMGLKPSKLPWLVLGGALTGTLAAVAMQAWMNGIDYAFIIGGKPRFSYQSYLPVAFEITVLFGVLTTILGMFALNKLPQPYHPLFTHPRFSRATDDAFFLSVEATDPRWHEGRVRALLQEWGGAEITLIRGESGGGM